MITFEEIKKIFEYKPDLYQFLNSPLFFLIVAIVLVIFLIIAWRVLRKPKKEKKKKIHFRKKEEEPEETISEDTARAQTDFYERQIRDKESVEESSDYEEPVVPDAKVDEKEMVILGEKEIALLSRDEISATVLFNNNGIPEVKRFSLLGDEYKKLKEHGIILERRKPVYVPYSPESKEPPSTERATPLEKSKSDEISTKVVRYSPDELGDVEREVDELTAVKKKPKFLSRFAILMEELEMRKKKEVETAKEQTTETSSTMQPTEKEVFEDDIPEDKEPEMQKETVKEPRKEDTQPTQQEGESKRQIVLKLLEQGKTKDEILKTTGYAELTIIKYVNDWTDSQLNVARQLFVDGRWNLVKRIVEVLDRQETFLVEDGKLYYPGRDRLTYVFLVTTIILACIAVAELFIL
jgi:hypothetical protein